MLKEIEAKEEREHAEPDKRSSQNPGKQVRSRFLLLL